MYGEDKFPAPQTIVPEGQVLQGRRALGPSLQTTGVSREVQRGPLPEVRFTNMCFGKWQRTFILCGCQSRVEVGTIL